MKNIKIKKTIILFALLTSTLFTHKVLAQISGIAVGDIIFHKSQSQQSAALKEATGSSWTHVGIIVRDKVKGSWYVAEAIGPVKATPLKDFIARGKNKEYRVYRNPAFNPSTMTERLYAAIRRQNKPYDIYFEFTDDRTYCSELVYKAMMEVTGQGLGQVQKMKEMNLTGPYVKALIKKRLTDIGKKLNPEEPIITPISQMRDSNLILVKASPAK